MFAASDNGDGSGITVTVADEAAGWTYTAEVRDTAKADWRAAGVRVGNGILPVGVGKAGTQVSLARTYWVRVWYDDGAGGVGTSTPELVTPTQALYSDVFALILELQADLIRLNLPEVGGKVVRCIDPNGAGPGIVDQPALWVFQPEGFVGSAIDNRTTTTSVTLEVGISDRADGDWVERLQWWTFIPWKIFWTFNRLPAVDPTDQSAPARKWDVTRHTIVRPDDPRKYQYRYQALTFAANVERELGG